MKKTMDFEGLLADGGIDAIREYLKENIHQYGKLKTSRQILKDVTGEDFNPEYYVRYLKEKYTRIYGLKRSGCAMRRKPYNTLNIAHGPGPVRRYFFVRQKAAHRASGPDIY